MNLFDLLPEDDEMRVKHSAIKSTDWKWTMKDDYPKEKNGLEVFSCFACGGGSTMGYKLAGCEVLGCCEIDPKMNEVYQANHNPKYNYLMDIREFNKLEDLPEELYNLDILDGSPPCTTFSTAGDREKSWGKKKKFREGQAEQTLDDLSFVFIETVAKLRPKVMIMENVEGLLKGEAWSYVQKIYKQLHDIGYKVKHWLLKGQYMGVPQTRHRVFFVALRDDVKFDLTEIDMSFNYEPIPFGKIKEGEGGQPSTKAKELLEIANKSDKSLGDIVARTEGRTSMFNVAVVWDDDICPTIHNHGFYRGNDKVKFSIEDYRNAQTFPEDYQFENVAQASYICGMSVPPLMIKRIVTRLIEAGMFDYKMKGEQQ
jgi:DNA (cytosine-5)-methyltransferase 1